MAEEGSTFHEWASCEVDWDDVEAEFVMVAQDGSFDGTVITEFPGVCVLRLRADRGIDEHECTYSFGILHAGFLGPIAPDLEHINDTDKRVRLWTTIEEVWPNPFVLTINKYSAVRSGAGAL